MSDLQTLDLFRIHENRAQLETLHRLQLDRADERAITGGDRPDGMRLSTADPVRRVKAAFDPFWRIPFDEGMGARGHLLEDYLEVALFHSQGIYAGNEYASQVPIQWHAHGRSAFDFVMRDAATDERRVVSCKSSIGGGKPTAANVDQERRMMALAGFDAGSEFEVWVIDPGTFRAVGPYEYTMNEDDLLAVGVETSGVARAHRHWSQLNLEEDVTLAPEWNDPDYWQLAFGLTSTSGAFRYDTLDASGAIEKRNRLYLAARRRAAEAKAEADAAKALIRVHVEEQINAAREAGETIKSVRAYSGDMEATYTIDARGALLVKERAREDAAPHEAVTA
jgi:hypothetical protein